MQRDCAILVCLDSNLGPVQFYTPHLNDSDTLCYLAFLAQDSKHATGESQYKRDTSLFVDLVGYATGRCLFCDDQVLCVIFAEAVFDGLRGLVKI